MLGLIYRVAYFKTAGGFEVNFMDDVGQTLLNWASAFGTLEMVGYLQLYRFENVFLGIFNKYWLYMYCLFCHMGGMKKIC